MSCRELVRLVTDYLEGALDGPTRRRFEAHLAGCEGCAEFVAQLRATIGLVGRLAEADLPPAMEGRLRDAFRGWAAGAGQGA